jgi:ADP-heptose:LPS heptosyltransferase
VQNTYRDFKNISNYELKELGIKVSDIKVEETIEDLKKAPPNIVIGECIKTIQFTQNNYPTKQQLTKKVKYIMGLGIYHQLFFDTSIKSRNLKPAPVKFKNMYRPYSGQDLTNKTLLVFRTGGIGDLLFIQPNLIYLKNKYPTCKILFACGPNYQSMVKTWDCVDDVVDLPFPLYYMINSDYHAIFEGVIERTKQAEKENAYNLFTKWMGLNLPDELLVPKQEATYKSTYTVKNTIEKMGLKEKDFITIQMRSSSPIRNPNPKVWKKLIDVLTKNGHKIVLTDMPQMERTIDEFIKTLDNKELVFNFSPHSKEISDSIALASLSKMCIGTDSALNHISISLGVKSFGIFGPFPAEIRLSTYPKNLCDWINIKDDCSPCFVHSMTTCKNTNNGYSKCYDKINIEECVEKIERLLII